MWTRVQHSDRDLLSVYVDREGSACKIDAAAVPVSADHCRGLAKQETLRRRPIPDLCVENENGSVANGKASAAGELLEQIGGQEIELDFGRVARSSNRVIGAYLALMHFARRCEAWSLTALNGAWRKFGIPTSVWAEAVAQFGKCKFFPATENLVNSLNAASLNVVVAASASLGRMFPDGPKEVLGDEAIRVLNGRGVWFTKSGAGCTGTYTDNIPHADVQQKNCTGDPGSWSNCVATVRYGNANVYHGEFVNGHREGIDMIEIRATGTPDGTSIRTPVPGVYVGEFKGDRLNGRGMIWMPGAGFYGVFTNNVLAPTI
jgi:hypothetical protein